MKTAAAYTRADSSAQAGRDLAEQVKRQLGGAAPDAVIVFVSARLEYTVLLEALREGCSPRIIVGSSSAGEFTNESRGEESACALALHAPDLELSAGLGRGVSEDPSRAAGEVVSSFQGIGRADYPYRAALVMSDALAGRADDLIEQLVVLTSGKYEFAGGGAGDDAKFTRTHVFLGTRAFTDAVVALEVLSQKPIGVGVSHGWIPASAPFRVTEARENCLVSLNGMPAVEALEAHAEATGQRLDRSEPLPFFLHNILGIDTGEGYRLRVPLSVADDGSIICAAEVPAGVQVRIMKTSNNSAVEAAASATRSAVQALGNEKPGAALFFDCVATRLRMGEVFGFELDTVARTLSGATFVGCNTYGQFARGNGQFSGFHNCTAVVFVLPT